MTTIHNPQISNYRLITLKGAVKLEARGMKRRGRSARSIAIEELGLPKRSSHEEVVAAIEKELEANG